MAEQDDTEGIGKNLDNFKRRAFELCLAVYRVTSLFPKNEVLVGQMRECSSKIIVFLATGKIRDTILKVDEIKIYLEIAKNQKWLAPLNFDLLKNAYSLLADSLARRETKSAEREVKIIAAPLPKEKKENKERLIFEEAGIRLEKIIGYFNKNKEAKVTDLIGFLGAISERTVRNDLSVLINKNFIKRLGSRKNARYFLISR